MKLKINNGLVEINGQTILEKVNFEVNDGDHIGIVGRNGAGKTTLLKALIDHELFSSGIGDESFEINKIGQYSLGYLEQININEHNTLINELMCCYQEIIKLNDRINYLENHLVTDRDILEYTNLIDQYQLLGGYTYKKQIEVMINKFGFTSYDKDKLIKEFSGGEKMKISFMKLLLTKTDLLILDEPTNHLDIKTIEWLEEYLRNYKQAFIIVSHDRMFLDNTVNIVYDIEYGEVIKYSGNYSQYLKLKNERYNKLLKDYTYQQTEIKRLHSIYERFRSKPTKAKMALSKLKQIERMTLIDKPHGKDVHSFRIKFKDLPKPGKDILNVKNLQFGYYNVLGEVSFSVERGKKIGIIGANGSGKSTLLKTIGNIISPLSGNIKLGFNVISAYFDQNLNFQTSGTILDELRNCFTDLDNEELRKLLGSFLFSGEDVFKNLSVLSGGEKVRLLLCKVLSQKANLLLLDEPTNHLDLIGKEKLESLLKTYPEAIIFVSHDRYFVKELADELIVFENNEIKYYKCRYDEYLAKRKQNDILENNLKLTDHKDKTTIVKKTNHSLIKKIEKELEYLYQQRALLTEKLYQEEIYNDYQKSNDISSQIEVIDVKIELTEREWEKYF